MTILPKGKKSHSNAKGDRYGNGRGHSSPSTAIGQSNVGSGMVHDHHRYGNQTGTSVGVSGSGSDITSGAMVSGASVSGASGSQQVLAANRKPHRKHSSVYLSTGVNGPGMSPNSASQSQGQLSPNIHGHVSGLKSPQSPNPIASQLCEKMVQPHSHSTSSKRRPGSSKSAVTQNNENCNSDDEYGAGFKDDELESRFADRLKKARGLVIKEVKGDGACMFRAVADQIYGDEEMHDNVRSLCMDYIAKNRDHFSQFVTEDFDLYLRRKREMDTHGNHVELQAVSEIFSRPIEIYEYSIDPINTFHPISPEANTGHENPPLRLSYHGTVHYNSVIDPFSATIGVGLGLPEFKPGSADRNLMKEAAIASEAQHIEEAMLNDKLRMTDWERTEEELGKQIARDSYMEYLRQLEQNAEESYKHNTDESHEKDELEEHITTSKPADNNKLSSPLTVSTDNMEQRTNSRFGQRCLPSTSRHSSSLGAKRGASSPNIPCCSRDERNRELSSSPLAKIHRNETSSMPNISPIFGDSFTSRSINADSMRPSTSASSFSRSLGGSEFYSQTGNNRNDKLSENVASTSAGLYEELLASSALAFDDWAGSTAALDDAAILARAMAVSQAEFYENLRKSPRS